MPYIKKLGVSQFRNYQDGHIDNLSNGFVVLIGPNGAGKTNLLEAVSLLSPGRGLRSSKISDIQNKNTSNSGRQKRWAVSALLETDFGEVQLGTGASEAGDKRIVRIQGETARAQADLGEYLSCIWLTPQMDSLFRDGASERRRFLDRLITSHDPAHSGRITRYEKALYQRSKLLKNEAGGQVDFSWVSALERQMAEAGMAIAAARVEYVERLYLATKNHIISSHDIFPQPELALTGQIEEQLQKKKAALDIEDMFCVQLQKSRELDAIQGGASIGPHRTDMKVKYLEKNMPAEHCSTGEQKALLIGLVLAHAQLISAEKDRAPLLLFDEVAAHLDETRRANLFDIVESLGGQIWLSGTDESSFSHILDKACVVHVQDNGVLKKI